MLSGNYNEEYKSCVLKCKNGKHFFRIPNNPKTRKIWLDRLGLPSSNVNSRVCNEHFSEQMFSQSGKRLTRTAIPDKNIPLSNGNKEPDRNSPDQLESIIDDLLNKDDLSDGVCWINSVEDKNPLKDMSHPIPPSRCEANSSNPPGLENDSKLLMNYQLTTEGKHVCNVTELPQFILVFTAFRAKDTFITPPADLMPEYFKNADNSGKTKAKATRKSKLDKSLKNHSLEKTQKVEPVWNIKYVPYAPPENLIQRDREVQADMSTASETAEIAVQCDIEEEREAANDSSQLEWINHIIKAHVLNVEGDMYECHICGETASSYASNEKHSLVHKESSCLCFQCGRLFANHIKLKIHEKRVHMENKFEIKKALRCPKFHCTKAFHSRRQLFDHIDQHTKNIEQRCSKCQRSFSSFLKLHCHKSRRNCWT